MGPQLACFLPEAQAGMAPIFVLGRWDFLQYLVLHGGTGQVFTSVTTVESSMGLLPGTLMNVAPARSLGRPCLVPECFSI